MRRKALTCLLASANIGDETSSPTCTNKGVFLLGHNIYTISQIERQYGLAWPWSIERRGRLHQERCWQVPILGQAQIKVSLYAMCLSGLAAGCPIDAVAGYDSCKITQLLRRSEAMKVPSSSQGCNRR